VVFLQGDDISDSFFLAISATQDELELHSSLPSTSIAWSH
jgi:hypothetical protein